MNTMVAMVWVLALLCALVLTGTAISLFALHRAHVLLRALDGQRVESPAPAGEEALQELRNALEALAVRVHDAQRIPAAPLPDPRMPRPCLNLTKRSQALRMHRRGENPEQIASMLELPRQEVDLLLKVHRIVLSNV